MTDTVFAEGPNLSEAVEEAARMLDTESSDELHWELVKEHFRQGAWTVRISAKPLTDEERAAQATRNEVVVAAREWMQKALELLGVDSPSVVARRRGDTVALVIDSATDGRLLIGREGQNIRALRHLLTQALATEGVEYSLDVTDRRERDDRPRRDGRRDGGERRGRDRNRGRDRKDDKQRDEAIRAAAREGAQQVLDGGEEFTTEPLNSYERRLVHEVVKEFEGLDSRSKGRGSVKSVQIFAS